MLKKGISFFGVFSLASGAMISSGIFILPGLAYAQTGPAVFISYLLAGILGLIGIFSVIELATAMPKAGGDYYFINKILGPLFGTFSGFLGWLALSLKSAFAIFGISEIIYIYTEINPMISGLVLCLFFVILNIIGAKEAAAFQILMVSGLLLIMGSFIVLGLPKTSLSNFSPFLTVPINQIIITSGFIFISFGGLLKVATISEEVLNPKKNIPLGIIASVLVVTILYTFITFVITGTLDSESFKVSLTPVADSAKLIMGPIGYLFIIIASCLAFFTTANAGIMAASRYPLALSRDKLLPPGISRIHQKLKTPITSIIITGILIFLSLLLPLELLVKAASTVILTSYLLTNLAVIIMRESNIVNYKPSFKAPFYPWLQVGCVLVFTFFIIDLGAASIEISLSFVFLSIFVYLFYGSKVKNSEYALLHLMKRITDHRLTKSNIENELREIIINRDNIEQDSFDDLIKQAKIIDIDKAMNFKELLTVVAKSFNEEIGMAEEEIIFRFLERQKMNSSVVSDFLAIPHIVLDGEDKMFLIIVRCKKGINFSEEEQGVKAVFFIGGTREHRILHLKTIASIATLVGQKEFVKNWLSTENLVELKNLMILSNRERFY